MSGHKSESTVKQYAKKCPNSKKRQMCEALTDKLIDKKKRIEPKVEDVIKITEHAEAMVTPRTNQNPVQMTFPDPNMELFPMDDTDDDILLKFLKEFDDKNPTNPQTNAVVTNNVTNVSNTVMNRQGTPRQLLPQMYFPNSTVTINYNFNAK